MTSQQGGGTQPAGIRDVARLAGVSVASVSFALNGQPGVADDTRQRILEATYACVARWGLSKTTVEDAGKEAGVSRATVYRYFPGGREELISAVVSWEFLQFFTRLYDEIRGDLAVIADQGVTELFVDLNFDPEIGSPDADPAASRDRAEAVLAALTPE